MNAHCGPIKAYANGGVFRGPGSGTSDSITAQVPDGTFIAPADTTVKVSNGEQAFTPKQEQALGQAVLELIRQLSHKLAGKGAAAAPGAPQVPAYADGGTVNDPNDERYLHPSVQTTVPRSTQPAQTVDDINRSIVNGVKNLAAPAPRTYGPQPVATGAQVVDSRMPQPKPVIQPRPTGPISAAAAATQPVAATPPPAAPGPEAYPNVLTNTGVESIVPAGPISNYGAQVGNAIGHAASYAGDVVKTVVSAPGYGLNSPAGSLELPGAAPAAAAAPASPVPDVNRQALQPGTGTAAPAPVAVAPGVQKIVAPDGSVTYTDGGSPLPTGPISAQNQRAAQALSDKYAAAATAEAAPAPAAGQVTILPSSGSAQGATGITRTDPVFNTRGLSRREIARLSTQLAENAANNATSAGNTNTNAAVQREGQAITAAHQRGQLGLEAQRLGQQAPLTAAQTVEAQGKAAVTIQSLAARNAYNEALKSGDPKAIAAAERALRVIEGKEKPQRHLVVAGGQQVIDGAAVTQPSVVFDQETGRFIAPNTSNTAAAPAGASGTVPAGMRQVGTSGGKPVYEDAQGKRFIGG